MSEQTPDELERNVVGTLILCPHRLIDVEASLSEPDFASPTCRAAYRAIRKLRGETTFQSLADYLALNEPPPGQSWLAWVVESAQCVVSDAHLTWHVRMVRDHSRLRQATTALLRASQDAASVRPALQGEVDGFLSGIHASLETIQRIGEDGLRRAPPAVEGVRIFTDREKRGLDTGLYDLDHYVNGLKPGQVVLIGARPSVGKTTLALQIALNVAGQGGRVLFLSLEQSPEEIQGRAASNLSGVALNKIQSGRVTQEDFEAFEQAAADFDKLKLHIDELTGPTIEKVRSIIQRRLPVDLIVLDHLGLCSASGFKDNRNLQIAHISAGLKCAARETRVPLIALSQLSRAGDEKPKLAHLRDSGALEQDADIVFLLYDSGPGTPLVCDIAKNRNGAKADALEFSFQRECFRVRDLARYTESTEIP